VPGRGALKLIVNLRLLRDLSRSRKRFEVINTASLGKKQRARLASAASLDVISAGVGENMPASLLAHGALIIWRGPARPQTRRFLTPLACGSTKAAGRPPWRRPSTTNTVPSRQTFHAD